MRASVFFSLSFLYSSQHEHSKVFEYVNINIDCRDHVNYWDPESNMIQIRIRCPTNIKWNKKRYTFFIVCLFLGQCCTYAVYLSSYNRFFQVRQSSRYVHFVLARAHYFLNFLNDALYNSYQGLCKALNTVITAGMDSLRKK